MKYMVDDARVMRVSKRRRRRGAARRILVAAACLLIAAAVATAAIPTARAAVGGWLSRHFSARDYMGSGSGAHGAEPALDAVIRKVDGERTVTIRDLHDSEEARALAAGFGIRLDELACTGREIVITGWLTGKAGKFLLDQHTGGDTWREDSEYTDGDMVLVLPDGSELCGALNAVFTDEMERIVEAAFPLDSRDSMKPVYDGSGALVTTNARADALWNEWLENTELRFSMACSALAGGEPLTGQVEARLLFRQYCAGETLFIADLGSVRIDADAWRADSFTAGTGPSVTLGGTHCLFI
ncbi:MAG: hypothetical protein Q4C13_09340, partial [Clostridia bacterium]|nr:hypothetical protein [Clostridia bacterium]